MPFDARGLVLVSLLTQNLPDRNLAATLDIVGGMMGSPLGAVLIGALAQPRQDSLPTNALPANSVSVPVSVPGLVQVPDLWQSADEAMSQLLALGLVGVQADVTTTTSRIGQVLGSQPAAGEFVPSGSTVTVLVSAGVAAPNLVGKHVDEADALLTELGLEHFHVQSDHQAAPGIVFRQNPNAGARLSAGDFVTVYFYEGRRYPDEIIEAEVIVEEIAEEEAQEVTEQQVKGSRRRPSEAGSDIPGAS